MSSHSILWRSACCSPASASAADIRMPVKAPPPAPVAVYNWTGCYVGAGGGYGHVDQEFSRSSTAFRRPARNDNGGRGWFGTVQVGCDYQVGSNIVIGAFGDYDFSGIKGDCAGRLSARVGEEKLKTSWAAGGRIGWIPWPAARLLVFVVGRLHAGAVQRRQFDSASHRSPLHGDRSQSTPTTAGSSARGYEYGLGLLAGPVLENEYRFADYGTERVDISPRLRVPIGRRSSRTNTSRPSAASWSGASTHAPALRTPPTRGRCR